MKLKILALVFMLGIVGRVDAGYESGGALLSKCESENMTKQNICWGYLAGVSDASDTWASWDFMTRKICIPYEVNVSQLEKIFIKYANQYPEELHQTKSPFRDTFTCRTCHDPHKGRTGLLAGKVASRSEACAQCHIK